MVEDKSIFNFEISLSILNHLGRNLYRSFMTILGEAISNSWDADANNVWIYIDTENQTLIIKDDGDGMNAEDFQNKFLKIGYSKRKEGSFSAKERPYIGRKGIGKLALLSCAKKISILTRKSAGDEYIGGVIDNSDLDIAIKDDLKPNEYILERVDESLFRQYQTGLDHGTIIYFEDITEGIRNNIKQIKKVIALYFRFSLKDNNFNIFVNENLVTIDDLDELAKKTEFLWIINGLEDPYITQKLVPPILKEKAPITFDGPLKGFIGSVQKPRDLSIFGIQEKVGVDLFVNGRLRERDILRHIPTARIYENYLYGQIHYDELDDEIDRFTSNREGIVADDPKLQDLLTDLQKKVLPRIGNQWDEWRIKHKQEGDSENTRLTVRDRKSLDLFNTVSEDYSMPEESAEKEKVDMWVYELAQDAKFNFSTYAECFISENLIRKYINYKNIILTKEARKEKDKWQKQETQNMNKANISITIRRDNSDCNYLAMDALANLVDKVDPLKQAGLSRDAIEYKPFRDAVAHTALLTESAKQRMTTIYLNIKERIRTLLSNP